MYDVFATYLHTLTRHAVLEKKTKTESFFYYCHKF